MRRRAMLLAALALPRVAWAGEMSVRLKTFAFVPATLSVPVGTQVTWTNDDDTPHTITSSHRPPLFRSGALDSDDSFSTVFEKPGAYPYFCSLHPHMQGVVFAG